jgi:glycosyltransferase involved in cell wall biosynthesis
MGGPKLRVLQVIHGYPDRYSAGSEVYTQTLCHGLLNAGHKVHVFTREENPHAPEYAVSEDNDPDRPEVGLTVVNIGYSKDRFAHDSVDLAFAAVLARFRPDVVHFGHLNHLSTGLVRVAKDRGLPIIFTLHDYWLACPRGQFLQFVPGGKPAWRLCDGQADGKCASTCYSRYHSGIASEVDRDEAQWEDWVHGRMQAVKEAAGFVDTFVSPSQTVTDVLCTRFGVPGAKVVQLDYGFDLTRLSGRDRSREGNFVFGFIGTHKPAKGVSLLLEAFGRVRRDVALRIWGHPDGANTAALRRQAAALPDEIGRRIEWMGGYRNAEILRHVFNHVDALVVPSTWLENSPLVIHEAQQARVPVIASALGGMAEFVHDGVNGLLFPPGDAQALADAMGRLASDPALASRLGERGYLYSRDGDVPSIESHVDSMVGIYEQALTRVRVVTP